MQEDVMEEDLMENKRHKKISRFIIFEDEQKEHYNI